MMQSFTHAQGVYLLMACLLLLAYTVTVAASPLGNTIPGAPENDLRVLQEPRARHRSRRSIGDFGDMIRQVVQREALLYNRYGNHCGFGGDGLPTVDEVDRCCQAHDACYIAANAGVCANSWFSASFIYYNWSWNGEVVTCSDEDPCKRQVCQCDVTATLCFREHPYNPEFKRSSIFDLLA